MKWRDNPDGTRSGHADTLAGLADHVHWYGFFLDVQFWLAEQEYGYADRVHPHTKAIEESKNMAEDDKAAEQKRKQAQVLWEAAQILKAHHASHDLVSAVSNYADEIAPK